MGKTAETIRYFLLLTEVLTGQASRMALFWKILFGIVVAFVLFCVTGFFWAINGGSAEGWFKQLISNPIPPSVTELKYGGMGFIDSVRCFSFKISPSDLEKLIKSYPFKKEDAEIEKTKIVSLFKQFSKIPVGDLNGYEAFSSREFSSENDHEGIYRLFLVSPSKNHVYCLIGT